MQIIKDGLNRKGQRQVTLVLPMLASYIASTALSQARFHEF